MTKIQRHRTQAFNAQNGRCYYCDQPMWNKSPSELEKYGLRQRTAKPLRCTAEHLLAKQDGGRDEEDNIVAACLLCNMRRHKRKTTPAPEAYRTFVQRLMAKGKWYPFALTFLVD